MKDKNKRRKELLSSESKLETFADKLYVDRFSDAESHWRLESKVEWGEQDERC